MPKNRNAINRSSPFGEIRRLCRRFNNLFQVRCGLRDHFATTVAHLSPSCALSVAIVYLIFFVPLYIIVMPYFRHFGVFVPKIGDFGEKSGIYNTREV